MQVIVEPAQWMHRCGNCRQQLQRIDGVQDLRPVRRQHADARALADAETRERLLIPARRITDIADAQHRSTQQLQQRTTGLLVERIGEQIGNEQRPVQIIVHATSPCVSVSAREHSASAPLYCRVMKSRTPPKRRNAIQTKAKILAAAQQAFSETGYSQSGIRDIAAIADVSSTQIGRASCRERVCPYV